MKKLYPIYLVLSLVITFIWSCEKDPVSVKHIYSDEELAYIDSIEAEKKKIKANEIINIDVLLPLDTSNYRSVPVQVDGLELASKFGLSSAEALTAAFGTVSGGAQSGHSVKFYAINSSTQFDFTGAYTANGLGYWFDRNGDVVNWGDPAYLFMEFDQEAFTYYIGQFPKKLKTGETYRLIQLMVKDNYRVALVFNVTVGDYYKEPERVVDIVGTYDIEVEAVPDNSYAAVDFPFDYAAAAAKLGVSTTELTSNLTFLGYNSDGTSTATYTADAGYWFNKSANVTNWGTEACILYVNYSEGAFKVGQFPDAAMAGESYTVKVGLLYKDTKVVIYNLTLKIIGFVDPETPPPGDPENIAMTFEVKQPYASDWSSSSSIDVRELLKQAFKKTTYQIHQAIESGELKFSGLNADGSTYLNNEGEPASTANHPGHWFGKNGNVTVWGSTETPPFIYSELGHGNETLSFNIGHHPENAMSGDSVTVKQIAELNGGKATLTFNIKVE